MSTSKSAALTATDLVDWTGVPLQRIEYEPAATIFAQGDPATSVMYWITAPCDSRSCRTLEKRR